MQRLTLPFALIVWGLVWLALKQVQPPIPGSVSSAFSAGTAAESFLKAFERIVICDTDPATFRTAYGLPASVRVYGPWSGNLSNAGERIRLKDKNGVVRCTLDFGDRDPWPVAADGSPAMCSMTPDRRSRRRISCTWQAQDFWSTHPVRNFGC